MSDAPLPNHRCPICNGPNGCVPARSGSFGQPCWCSNFEFSPGLLERVPREQRGKACICAACALTHSRAAAAQAQP